MKLSKDLNSQTSLWIAIGIWTFISIVIIVNPWLYVLVIIFISQFFRYYIITDEFSNGIKLKSILSNLPQLAFTVIMYAGMYYLIMTAIYNKKIPGHWLEADSYERIIPIKICEEKRCNSYTPGEAILSVDSASDGDGSYNIYYIKKIFYKSKEYSFDELGIGGKLKETIKVKANGRNIYFRIDYDNIH